MSIGVISDSPDKLWNKIIFQHNTKTTPPQFCSNF